MAVMSDPEYLGDGVYVTFDGYYIWLRTGSHQHGEATNRIALDPGVFEALLAYRRKLVEAVLERRAMEEP
jgi:hypothetical protein